MCLQAGWSLSIIYNIQVIYIIVYRTYTKSLVSGISRNKWAGCYTYEDDIEEYSHAKAAGLVQAVRHPGDDNIFNIFGPIKDAIM